MSSINNNIQKIIEDFAVFEDWMEKYEHIVEMGKNLPAINPEHKNASNLIKGCQSKVWLHAEYNNGKIVFTADSDAIITKGIVSVLINVFSNQSPQEILSADMSFIDKIGLKEHLSPTRSNGLVAMIKQIQNFAIAFQVKYQN